MGESRLAGISKFDNLESALNRRMFLAGASAAATVTALQGAFAQSPVADDIPIIDAHIHLFDGTRPLGAGYMGSQAYRAISKTSLPSMYSPLARPVGIVGAIVVESSAWIDDNLWYLETCRTNPIMVGVSGTLDPGTPDFGRYVDHFHKDPLFRAIRSSRFYSADNGKVALKPDQVGQFEAAGSGRSGAGHSQSQHGSDAGQRAAGRCGSRPSHHHGPSAVLRSHARQPAGVRSGSEGDGGPPQHLRQAHRGVSSAPY